MNLTIKTTRTSLTDSLRTAIEEKLSVLESFLKSQHKLSLELEVDAKHKSGLIFRVEILVKPDGHFAEARGKDAYEALDILVPKIKEQLVKKKDKRISDRRKLGEQVKKSLK